jgi:hypothetical protein
MEVNGEPHTPDTLSLGKEPNSIHWIGGWVGHRAGTDILEKRWISCSCWNLNPRLPNCSLVTIVNTLPLLLPIYNIFTPSLCFMTFSFNAPCQITPLLNPRSLTFSLMPCSILLTPYPERTITWFTLAVSGIQQQWHKTRAGVRIMI